MINTAAYCCTELSCHRAPLSIQDSGLSCPNGHHFSFVTGTHVPVFSKEEDSTNEYARSGAAEVHDNALRWVFATFMTDEPTLRTRLVARLQLTPGQKVLVTGAGAGNDLPYLARDLQGSGEIHAQDIAAQMLLKAMERHQGDLVREGVDSFFSLSDAMNLPYADGYFDAAYHFGGVNLFPDIRQGISEMARVVRPGGRIVIGDEGVAPWLRDTELGKMLIRNNPLYASEVPLALLPSSARDVSLTWELGNCFFVIAFRTSSETPPIDIDVPHVGIRGGSIRTRYFGQLEGIDPALRDRINAEAERSGLSRVEFLERLLRRGLPEGRD